MTRQEAMAFGVPEERLKEFQDQYHKDLRKTAQSLRNDSERPIRGAISSMLGRIHNLDQLREILMRVTEIYCRPIKARPEDWT